MKIRIKGNSIRIRLSRTEVSNFGKIGYIEEHTEFGGGVLLTYALSRTTEGTGLTAVCLNNKITMYMPADMAAKWVDTEEVGFSNNMEIGEGKSLFLLLEKDFKCIDSSVPEDQSDNYDNPLHTCN